MTTTALLALVCVFLACLWGGLVVGPDRLLPFLMFSASLLLPANVVWNLPGLPDLDRHTAITLPALVLLVVTSRERWAAYRTAWPDLLLYLFVAWAVLCVFLIQGAWAAQARFLQLATMLLVPWIGGRLYLRSNEDLLLFVRAVLPLVIVYLVAILVENRLGAVFRPGLYGIWTMTDMRFGLYRPIVFASDSLELGHHLGLAAILLFGAYRGWKGRGEPVPRFVLVAAAAATLGVALTLSRGPVLGLAFAFLGKALLRNSRWLGVLLGIAGFSLYLWMMAPEESASKVAALVTTTDEPIGSSGQTLSYRFHQIDQYKPMVWTTPWIGFGEQWRRPVPAVVIDGILLIYTLSYGFPGAFLIVAFWLSVAWYVGRGVYPGNTPYAYIGAYLAPVIGWLTFSAWGDSFLRHAHLLVMSAVVGAMYTERKLAKPLLPPVQKMVFRRG